MTHTPDYYRRQRANRARFAPARDALDRAMWRWIVLWLLVAAVLALVEWIA